MRYFNTMLIVCIMLFIVLGIIVSQMYTQDLERYIRIYNSKIQELQKENEDLRLYIYDLQTIPKQEELIHKEVCSTSIFKSWMDYRAITSPSSKQYKLQTKAITNDEGHRVVDGHILVAMGPRYGPVGTKYKIFFEDGSKLDVMIGDIKHEGCTSSNDGSMIEFIVDSQKMSPIIKRLGNYNAVYTGKIIFIAEKV